MQAVSGSCISLSSGRDGMQAADGASAPVAKKASLKPDYIRAREERVKQQVCQMSCWDLRNHGTGLLFRYSSALISLNRARETLLAQAVPGRYPAWAKRS